MPSWAAPWRPRWGGSPGACVSAEACVEEDSEDDPVALLQAQQPVAATGADEDWWRRRAGRSVAAAGAVVGSMTGEELADASHTHAVQTQDPLTPRVGLVAGGDAANRECRTKDQKCELILPVQKSYCCRGSCTWGVGNYARCVD
ncbi:unnamed protein product [Polarella glacialis]|uniref:Uncharacterized protein n=1 Tax=Polarella glacialis TaxID=89957 RepID=A0A813FWB3_POLGL|nr:unnamed protein product [Polarella glacialis]